MHGSLGPPPSPRARLHLDRFSRFVALTAVANRRTHRPIAHWRHLMNTAHLGLTAVANRHTHTDHATSVTIGRILLYGGYGLVILTLNTIHHPPYKPPPKPGSRQIVCDGCFAGRCPGVRGVHCLNCKSKKWVNAPCPFLSPPLHFSSFPLPSMSLLLFAFVSPP